MIPWPSADQQVSSNSRSSLRHLDRVEGEMLGFRHASVMSAPSANNSRIFTSVVLLRLLITSLRNINYVFCVMFYGVMGWVIWIEKSDDHGACWVTKITNPCSCSILGFVPKNGFTLPSFDDSFSTTYKCFVCLGFSSFSSGTGVLSAPNAPFNGPTFAPWMVPGP
jgi:hypothetical protein